MNTRFSSLSTCKMADGRPEQARCSPDSELLQTDGFSALTSDGQNSIIGRYLHMTLGDDKLNL